MIHGKRFPSPALLSFLLLLGGCGEAPTEESGGPGDTAPAPDTVASHAGGTISLAEVESHLGQTQRSTGTDAAELLESYRQAAENLVIRRHVSGLLGDPIEVSKQRGEYPRRHRQAVLGLYLEAREADAVEVSEADARDFYEANTERFHQAPQRFAWHIFRRHRGPSATAETDALLRDLKRRILAGEPFAELARGHSHSETRVSGGRLGWISRGQIDPSLEGPLFALEEGEVSDPLPVPNGAILFQVTEVRRETQHPFEDVRGQITEELEQRRHRQAVTEAVAGLEPPPGSLILDQEGLENRMKVGDADATALEIGDFRLTMGEISRRLAGDAGARASGERLFELYRHQVEDELLYRHLTASGWAESEGRGATLQERLTAEAVPQIVDSWLEERMRERLEGAETDLRAFHRDNRHLYQSSLRLELQTLSIAAEAGASGKMAEMERLREKLLGGEIDFAAAAARLGTEVVDLGWSDFEQLQSLAPKIRTHVLDVGSTGYTVPFYHEQRLHLTWVKSREEPRPLAFDEVEDRVRDDYYQRFQQNLYREVASEILDEQEFRFYEESVRSALSLPA